MKDELIDVLIFGTSKGSELVLGILDFNKVNIVAFLDNDETKQGCLIYNKKIISPYNIENIKYDYIIIASISFEIEMKYQLTSLGVSNRKIITPLNKVQGFKAGYYKRLYKHFLDYKNVFTNDFVQSVFDEKAFCSINFPYSKKRSIFIYDYPDYGLEGIDYVRVSTVELLAREINEKRIIGEVAELGVYKGNFTKLLSKLFNNRKLYLFDTFEGFSEKDIESEQKHGYSKAQKGYFGNTNIDIVMKKINKNQKVIVKKGYFPYTTEDLQEEIFAFVSIDVDLYKPTYEGLIYFYKRLAKGGYIIVHDYNYDRYKGVKEAVKQFSEENNVSFVPISDYFGSVIITK